jgi:hypothetical protein
MQALNDAATLSTGACGLSDGSIDGEWRLPSRFELESLLNLEYVAPALSNAAGTGQWVEGDAFTAVQTGPPGPSSANYWSSSAPANYPAHAWIVYFFNGDVNGYDKATSYLYAWPVRNLVMSLAKAAE